MKVLPNRMHLVLLRWQKLGLGTVALALLSSIALYAFRGSIQSLQLPVPLWIFFSLLFLAPITYHAIGNIPSREGLMYVLWHPPLVTGLLAYPALLTSLLIYAKPEVFNSGLAQMLLDERFLLSVLTLYAIYIAYFSISVSYSICHETIRSLKKYLHNKRATCEEAGKDDISMSGSLEWIYNDEPISSKESDKFGHYSLASTMASRVIQNDIETNSPKSQALIGPLGAGKSGIILMMRSIVEASEQSHRIRFVMVSLWEYLSVEAAVSGIITALIDELGKNIDTLDLRHTSDRYLRAAGTAGGTWSLLTSLFHKPETPFQVLEDLGRALRATNLQFVLCVEDLERFAVTSNSFAKPGQEGTDPAKMNAIRALLYNLHKHARISVVLAASVEVDESLDLEKNVQYLERIPDIEVAERSKILDDFRKMITSDPLFIDSAARSVREKITTYSQELYESRVSLIYDTAYTNTETDALLGLFANPRALKLGLREFLDFWTKNKGEVDLDDLLVLSLVKQLEPELSRLIRENIGQLRIDKHNKEYEAIWSRAKQQIENLKLYYLDRSAAGSILKLLFDVDPVDKPQGVISRVHIDYFKRLRSSLRVELKHSDQRLLQLIDQKEAAKIANELCEGDNAHAVENFKRLFTGKLLIDVLPLLIDQIIAKQSRLSPYGQPPEGFISHWRMTIYLKQNGEIHPDDLVEPLVASVVAATKGDLSVLSDIKYYYIDAFRQNSSDSRCLLRGTDGSTDSRARVIKELHKVLVNTYASKPQELVQALSGKNSFTLRQILYVTPREPQQPLERDDFIEWPRFSNAIVQAMHISTQVMLPMIAACITKDSPDRVFGSNSYKYVYLPEHCADLFKNNQKLIEEEFRKADPSQWTDEVSKALVSAIKEALQ